MDKEDDRFALGTALHDAKAGGHVTVMLLGRPIPWPTWAPARETLPLAKEPLKLGDMVRWKSGDKILGIITKIDSYVAGSIATVAIGGSPTKGFSCTPPLDMLEIWPAEDDPIDPWRLEYEKWIEAEEERRKTHRIDHVLAAYGASFMQDSWTEPIDDAPETSSEQVTQPSAEAALEAEIRYLRNERNRIDREFRRTYQEYNQRIEALERGKAK